jgi:hypothetical protein
MTDEERRDLVKDLREASDMQVTHWARVKAADEIKRLEKENEMLKQEANPLPKQSDAKPVAWRVRDFGDGWILCHSRKQAEKEADAGNLVQPLYTAPPRADTSAADYDRAWGAIATSDELANVRRKLSIHELRLLIRVVLTGSARAAGRIWK